MIVSQDDIKKAIDAHIAENTPQDGFISAAEIRETMYPDKSTRNITSIMDSMIKEKKVERSTRKYGTGGNGDGVWYYKIL